MDRTLVERAQRGDREAYEAVARAAAPALYRIAYRIVRDSDRADDAVQQTLVAIWRELPSLRDVDRFSSWTYRLVVRFCTAESRRNAKAGVRFIAIDDTATGRGDAIGDVATRDQLERALQALSVEHRTVVVLHHYVGLPLGEIAEILGIPYGTVGSRLHHATSSLRASLDAGDRSPVAGGQPA